MESVPIPPPTMLSFSSSSSSSSAPTSELQSPQTNPKPDPIPKQEVEPEPEPEVAYKLIPSLPDDVALNCLAHVPHSHHPTLSLVSKPIRSLVSSLLFFNTRSILHATQPVLYLLLHPRRAPFEQWFAISLNPLGAALPHPLPLIPSLTVSPAYAHLGNDIYIIGGNRHATRSPQVWVLDCRFNRWRQGPTMLVPRQHAVTTVLNGKIYVMGGCDPRSSIWAEVLDPAIGSWEELVSPYLGSRSICEAVGGKLYATSGFAYDPRNRVWESIKDDVWFGVERSLCLVGDVLYCFDFSSDGIKCLEVRDVIEGGIWKWKEVKGLDKVLPHCWTWEAAMATAAGKLFLVWKLFLVKAGEEDTKQDEIWCAQVEVHKNNEDGEFWGTLSWSQKILSLSEYYMVQRCFAVDM